MTVNDVGAPTGTNGLNSFVTVERRGPGGAVFAVRINRPPVNALSAEVRAGLKSAAVAATSDPTVAVVTLVGNEHCFSAGGDVDELAETARGTGSGAAQIHDDYLTTYESWRALPVPVVVGVRRYAYGGALELSLAGDLRLCSPDAVFAAAGVRMGLVESAHSLPEAIGLGRAARMLFTAEPIDANRALTYGLVTEIATDLEAAVANLADRIAANSPAALRATKEVLALVRDTNDPPAAAKRAIVRWRELERGEDHRRRAAEFLGRRIRPRG